MENIFVNKITVRPEDTDSTGRLELSKLLYYIQEASGGHSDRLGHTWEELAQRRLFWAVLRHGVQITRLPEAGETVTIETWPMPTTRVAYPRAVVALDEQGQELFKATSLWVLMDMDTRAMVLPGRSGVEVQGHLRGCEAEPPQSLHPGTHENSFVHTVQPEDLDVNGHVNNCRYLDWFRQLQESEAVAGAQPRAFTVCYLAETRLGQQILLEWSKTEDRCFTVDGCRERTDVPGKKERVLAIKVVF